MADQRASTKSYRKWYAKHREEFNAKRRARYRQDKEYRSKMLKTAKEYREKGAKYTAPEYTYRLVGDKEVKVYRISATADRVGRSVFALRDWEAKGIIPPSAFGDGHRVYTENQIKLMQSIAKVVDKYRYNERRLRGELDRVVERVYDHWYDGIEELRDE